MNANAVRLKPHGELPVWIEHGERSGVRRGEIESFVRERFAVCHGADVQDFFPLLIALRGTAGKIQAVLGLREAAEETLFLERYLDAPVERCLTAAGTGPVDRSRIMEMGNLAVAGTGSGRYLITVLTAYLHASQRDWVVFTIGPALRNSFRRLGLPLTDLGAADPGRLEAVERARWGTYYDQEPRVMAGRVADGIKVLPGLCEMECELMNLWCQATAIGRRAA